MHLYAFAMMAMKRNGNDTVGAFTKAGYALAPSRDEAKAYALEKCREQFPLGQYHEHGVVVIQIPDSVVAEAKP